MVGLPQTGKTTFLAAIWYLVQEPGRKTSLVLKDLSGDRTYLNSIRDAWLMCKPLERTTIQNEQMVTLHLEDTKGCQIALGIPDLSGETFQLQLRERRWSQSYHTMVEETEGVLLFVHPDSIRSVHRIDVANRMQAQLTERQTNARTTGSVSTNLPASVPWSHEYIPTQVQLVELIQFLRENRDPNHLLRIVIVVSAWDLVDNLGMEPKDLVEQKLPLLSQYLRANEDSIIPLFVGISAQGGDLEKDWKELLERPAPEARLRIIGLSCDEHDLTAPIDWILKATRQ